MDKKHIKINKLETIWDKIVDIVEFCATLFGGCALILCFNCIFFFLFLTPFILLSNGFETFNIYSEFFIELWQNYQIPIVIIIILAIVGVVRMINLEISLEDLIELFKEE